MSGPNQLKLTKVTNMKRGMEFVETAVDQQLVDMEDTSAGMKIENVLCIHKLQRYTTNHPHTLMPSADIATITGDMFAAIMHLSQEVKSLKAAVEELRPQSSASASVASTTEVATPVSQVRSVEDRIASLENNLRCLRETLTYEENEAVET